jgi:hypothetical protein
MRFHAMNATIAHSLATLARKSQALNGIGSTITSMETTGALMAPHLCGKETYSVPKDLSSTISDSVSSRRALPETAGADAGFGNLGGGRPRPSAYILSSTAASAGTVQLTERTRTVTGDLCGCTGHAAMSPDHPVSK